MKNAAPASTSLKLSTPVSMSNKAKAPCRHEHFSFYGPKQPPGSSRARRMRANYCNCLMVTLRAHRGNTFHCKMGHVEVLQLSPFL